MGGLIAAAGLGALLAEWVPFGIGASSLLGLGIGASGFLSGLVFSALKRQRGIKDWGTLLPGHGGMLDRLDSVCLTAPWFYWLLWFRFPGAP